MMLLPISDGVRDFDKGLQLEPDDAYAYFKRGCAKD